MKICILLYLCFGWSAVQAQFISTIAGTGTSGFSGEGGPAISANISTPYDVAIGPDGDVYFSTFHRICKVSTTDGIITTVAGNGLPGSSGDGGLATAARIQTSTGIAVDQYGNLFIADRQNGRVRKVDGSTGIITTVAGGGSGDDGELAVQASLISPAGVAIDNDGNIYLSDEFSFRIRKVDALTGTISTVAGNGNFAGGYSGDGGPATDAKLYFPKGLALDNAGNLFVADAGNHVIRKINLTTGTITTVAGNGSGAGTVIGGSYSGDNGQATQASFYSPNDVWVDGLGNLFIADSQNGLIRKVDAVTQVVTTAVGGGSAFPGDGELPTAVDLGTSIMGVGLDAVGNIYLTQWYSHFVRKVSVITGIESENGKPIQVFPNPVSAEVYVQGAAGSNLQIMDLTGRVVLRTPLANQIVKVDLTSLAPGSYTLRAGNIATQIVKH